MTKYTPSTFVGSLLLSFCLAVAAVAAVGPSRAAAAEGNILAPFPAGEEWMIWQGYSSGTHTGDNQFGLDLTIDDSATASGGRGVTYPIDGTLLYFQEEFGNVCVNTDDGRSYTLTHVNAANRNVGSRVSKGTNAGTVGNAGEYQNNGVAHIHFEMWSGPGCYGQSTPIPFDTAHNARICGAP